MSQASVEDLLFCRANLRRKYRSRFSFTSVDEKENVTKSKKINHTRNNSGSGRKKWQSTNGTGYRGYSHYLLQFWMIVIRVTLSLKFVQSLAVGSSKWAWAGYIQISKRRYLLRFPSICRKSFDYYTIKIVVSQTALFLLKIKKFRPGTSYWYKGGERAQSNAPVGNAFNTHTKNTNSSSSSSRLKSLPFYKYFRSLKWFPIPLSLGFALLAYQHYNRVLRRARKEKTVTLEESVSKDWEITCYRSIPWKSVSRAWGWVNSITLPLWTRDFVLGWYASTYSCDLSEAEIDDLRQYKNLGEFFRRDLKCGMRPIDTNYLVVSPSDGKVFHLGKVNCGVIEQVKGVKYSLQTFLGPSTWINASTSENAVAVCDKITNEEYCSGFVGKDKDTSLFYCVIYLAPGDYHRFHSPADWQVQFRRHFAGELLSVNPSVANWIGGLFSLNERAVYVGNWKHGFFSLTAVGATNVGSIRVYEDPTLQTNARGFKKNTYVDRQFEKPFTLKKGDCFGEFNFGSTIVMIFEAPNDFQFSEFMKQNERVKVGQGMFECASKLNNAV